MAMSTVDFILPDLGEGVHEAEIVSWKVKVGEVVEEMQTLAEMETDKALVEVPSPFSGTIVTLHGNEGEIALVGNPIVTFKDAKQGGVPVTAGASDNGQSTSATSAADHAQQPAADTGKGASGADDAGTVVGTMETQPSLGSGGQAGGKAMATPAVRRLATQLGVDIDSVAGSGRGGRITATDVQKAASTTGAATGPSDTIAPSSDQSPAGGTAPPAAAVTPTGGTLVARTIPISGVRRKIAEALSRSIRTAVHFTVMDTADVTALDRLRRQRGAASGERVSFLPYIVQAVCRALAQYPQMNANVDDEAREIHLRDVLNIGIAVDTPHGLMVPVVHNADQLGILPLGREIAALAEKCKSRKIALEQLRGGTFTISNVGSAGGAFATPIINYPEVAILGVGRAREAVIARDGGIFIGMQMPLSVSCDHRIVDGADAARMLNTLIQLLENPESLPQ